MFYILFKGKQCDKNILIILNVQNLNFMHFLYYRYIFKHKCVYAYTWIELKSLKWERPVHLLSPKNNLDFFSKK